MKMASALMRFVKETHVYILNVARLVEVSENAISFDCPSFWKLQNIFTYLQKDCPV